MSSQRMVAERPQPRFGPVYRPRCDQLEGQLRRDLSCETRLPLVSFACQLRLSAPFLTLLRFGHLCCQRWKPPSSVQPPT